mgnify:CR=1 FL=1
MSTPFQFKEFQVHQDQCAMKIGTDGVLLGAWTPVSHHPNRILDIGAGTGVVALMLAQRCAAESIDAIEIDEAAYEQCVQNFENAPWADVLFCYHAGLDELVDEMDEPYDLIVSNPPFYSEAVSSGDEARDVARQNQSLPFSSLITDAEKLLSESGIFAMIAPYKEYDYLLALGAEVGLFPCEVLFVKGNAEAPLKRVLIAFSRNELAFEKETLIIEEDRHQYTEAYTALTKDFYLKM